MLIQSLHSALNTADGTQSSFISVNKTPAIHDTHSTNKVITTWDTSYIIPGVFGMLKHDPDCSTIAL